MYACAPCLCCSQRSEGNWTSGTGVVNPCELMYQNKPGIQQALIKSLKKGRNCFTTVSLVVPILLLSTAS